MFLSNNSGTGLNNNNCIDQQPMFDRPFFINDVSPSSKMYPPIPVHDQYSSSFNIDHHQHHHHHHQNSNSSAADDQDFFAAFLQQHQDLLLVGQFSQQNTNTTTTSGSISKQTGTTTIDHQTLPLNNMDISNKNVVVDVGGRSSTLFTKKKKTSTTSTSKKDRHSKIVTAQGPRDRRMRLSLEIARRFFTLQDMLGFDKASKTVEWLLTKSKSAIKELTRSIKGSSNNSTGVSSISECEVASAFDHNTTNVVDDDDENKVQIDDTNSSNPKEKRVRVTRKPTFHPPPLAKDSRTKARARARERTIEKMRNRSMVSFSHNINQLRANSSSYETGGEESGSQSHHMRSTSLEMVADQIEDHPPAVARSQSLECQGPIGEEYSFVITRNSTSTSPCIDYNHEIKTSQGLNLNNNNNNNNNNCNFSENWDIDSGRAHSSYYSMANNMHLSTTDFQFVDQQAMDHIASYNSTQSSCQQH